MASWMIGGGIQAGRLTWEIACRSEDLLHREKLLQRFHVDDNRREANEKAEQLKSMSVLSGLFAGFCYTVLTNLQIPTYLSDQLICLVAAGSAIVICSMLLSMILTMYMLIGIYTFQYDIEEPSKTFEHFWATRCEKDWKVALRSFGVGMAVFLCTLGIITWIHAADYISDDDPMTIQSPTITSCICFVSFLFVCNALGFKWGGYLFSRTVTS